MTSVSTTILRECSEAFKAARRSVYEGAALLYQIDQTNAWEGHFGSFSEYVEQECQLSKGYASKLLQSWEYYVVNGGVSPRNLVGVDAEKLYLATKLPKGTPEQRFVKAMEWSRADLRDELASDEAGDCQHPDEKRIVLCTVCGKRLYEEGNKRRAVPL